MKDRQEKMQTIAQQLRVISRAVQAHSKVVERTCGLSSAKLWMMRELFINPGLKVSELARQLIIHPSTCSNMLDQLEKKNLIRRDRSTIDQRAVHLYLTEKGTELLATAPGPAQGTLYQALEYLDDEHMLSLEDGLKKLIESMQGKDKKSAIAPVHDE